MPYLAADENDKPEPEVRNHREGLKTVKLYERKFKNGFSAWDGFVYKPKWVVHTSFGMVVRCSTISSWREMLRYLKETQDKWAALIEECGGDPDALHDLAREVFGIMGEKEIRVETSARAVVRGADLRHDLIKEADAEEAEAAAA